MRRRRIVAGLFVVGMVGSLFGCGSSASPVPKRVPETLTPLQGTVSSSAADTPVSPEAPEPSSVEAPSSSVSVAPPPVAVPPPVTVPPPSAAVSPPSAAVSPPPAATPYYANCAAVRAAGAAPIRPGDPGFQPKFDRDGDGVGCE